VLNGGSEEEVARTFAACWASEDVREAARARTEKRPPVFRGS
jgi:enoyl-CoA hydratase